MLKQKESLIKLSKLWNYPCIRITVTYIRNITFAHIQLPRELANNIIYIISGALLIICTLNSREISYCVYQNIFIGNVIRMPLVLSYSNYIV